MTDKEYTLKELWNELKSIPDKLDLKRQFPGYFNIWIFRVFLILVFILGIYSMYLNDWGLTVNYYECNKPACKNPFYICPPGITEDCTPPGTIIPNNLKPFVEKYGDIKVIHDGDILGKKPGWVALHFPALAFSLMGVALIINHIAWRVKNVRKQEG